MADSTEFKVKFIADMKDFKASIDKIRKDTKGLTDTIAKAKKSQTTKGAAADRASTRGAMASLKLERERLKVQQEVVRLKERESRASMTEMRRGDAVLRRQRQNASIVRAAHRRRIDNQGGGTGFMMGLMPGHLDPRSPKRAPFAQRAGRFARGAAFMGAGGAIGWLIGNAMQSKGNFDQYRRSLGGLVGTGTGRQIASGMRDRMGSRLGYSMIDTAGHQRQMVQATGVQSSRELQQAMAASSMGAGEAAGMFGTMRQGGTTFTGAGPGRQSAGGNAFGRMLSMAVQSGLEKARRPEFLRGVQQFIAGENLMAGGKVTGQGFGRILAMMGKQGGVGFQGARGANVLSKMHQGMRSPGGGEWGESFMRQAFGFGTPGGRTGFFQAERMREQGIRGKGGAQRLMQVMGHVQATTGGGDAGSYLLKQLTGVSMEQADKLQQIFESDAASEEKLAQIEKVAKGSKTLQQQSLEAMVGAQGGIKTLAGNLDRSTIAGSKIAPFLDTLKRWSQTLFLGVVGGILRVVGWLKKIYAWISEDTDMQSAVKGVDESAIREAKGMAAKTPMARAAWRREAYTQAMHEKGRITRNLMDPWRYSGVRPQDAVGAYERAQNRADRMRRMGAGQRVPLTNLAPEVLDKAAKALEKVANKLGGPLAIEGELKVPGRAKPVRLQGRKLATP